MEKDAHIFSRISLCFEDLSEKVIDLAVQEFISSIDEIQMEVVSKYWTHRHNEEFKGKEAKENFSTLIKLLGDNAAIKFVEALDFPLFFQVLNTIRNHEIHDDPKRYKMLKSWIEESVEFIYSHRNKGGVPGGHSKQSQKGKRREEIPGVLEHYARVYELLELDNQSFKNYHQEILELIQRGTPNNLPAPTYNAWNGFSGRKKLLTLLGNKIVSSQYPIITVHGPGGVGKTALTHQLCERIKSSCVFSHLVWISAKDVSYDNIVSDLGPKRIDYVEDSLRHLFAAIVGVCDSENPREIFEVYNDDFDLIKNRALEILDNPSLNILIVLDNYETITLQERARKTKSELTEFVFESLSKMESVGRVLITSREKTNGAFNERIGNLEKYDAHSFLDNALDGLRVAESYLRKSSADRSSMHKIAQEFEYNPIRLTHLIGWIKKEASFGTITKKIANSGLDSFVFDNSLNSLTQESRELIFCVHHYQQTQEDGFRTHDAPEILSPNSRNYWSEALDECKKLSCLFETNGIIEMTSGLAEYLPKWAKENHRQQFVGALTQVVEWSDVRRVESANVCIDSSSQTDLRDALSYLKDLNNEEITEAQVLRRAHNKNMELGSFTSGVAALCSIRQGKGPNAMEYAKGYFQSENSSQEFNNREFWQGLGVSKLQLNYLINKKKHQIWSDKNRGSWNTHYIHSAFDLLIADERNPWNDKEIDVDVFAQAALREMRYKIDKKNRGGAVSVGAIIALNKLRRVLMVYAESKGLTRYDWYAEVEDIEFD